MTQYQTVLPQLKDEIEHQLRREFGRIKNVDAVARLSKRDPLRYLRFLSLQSRLQVIDAEIKAAAKLRKLNG